MRIRIKRLTTIIKNKSGRNHSGKITIRHRGGRHKRLYRMINSNNRLQGVARVLRIEYDPNRTGKIALLLFSCGIICYMLCAHNVCQGQKILIGGNIIERIRRKKIIKKKQATIITPSIKQNRIFQLADLQEGNVLPLRHIPLGSWVFNIAVDKNQRPIYGKSAGVYLKLITKKYHMMETGYAGLTLPSGQMIFVDMDVKATLGRVSNINHKLKKLTKAGENRWRGWRPSVRGVAMNPVDHPHGGGEGKTAGGRPSVSAWGRLTKGYKTKSKKLVIKAEILRRRRNKFPNFKDIYDKRIGTNYHKQRYFHHKKKNYFANRFISDKIKLQTSLYH